MGISPTCMCGGVHPSHRVHIYDARPEGEVAFAFAGAYHRELWQCDDDGHVVSVHTMDMAGMYAGAYADATYGTDGMRRTFDRVMALPPGRSDNAARVQRIEELVAGHLPHEARRVLDVGSGTGVFPARMQSDGWTVLASDPDTRAVHHLREVAGVDAVRLDFLGDDLGPVGTWDLVTLNKVLEHVIDPIAMLRRAVDVLNSGGLVYVEVPDAVAAEEGYGREEFFIDHHHVFTDRSARVLASRAGFEIVALEHVREASTKFTIRLLLAPSGDRASDS